MAAKKSSGSGKASTPKQDATQAKNRMGANKSVARNQRLNQIGDRRLDEYVRSQHGVKSNRMKEVKEGLWHEKGNIGGEFRFSATDALQGGRKRTATRATTTKKAAAARRKGAG